ncbi:MAG: DUF167 family protein [Thiotrichales bacterium]
MLYVTTQRYASDLQTAASCRERRDPMQKNLRHRDLNKCRAGPAVTFFRWDEEHLVLDVRVQPRASKNRFGEVINNRLKVYLTAPPVDGKANRFLCKFLGKEFKTAPSNIKIVSGETGRDKRVLIHHPSRLPAELADLNTGV